MRLAVIGSGISGSLAAHLLCHEHEVQLFEAQDQPGGHTCTVDVEAFGQQYAVDTGFMVFNERTYPNFCRLLRQLDVPSRDSDMSFSVCCQRTGLEYQGSSLNGLFAQRRNLWRPAFYGLLRDILRFNRQSLELLAGESAGPTMGQYLSERRYGRLFIDQYLVPMAAAIWSCRPRRLLEFPARFLVAFFQNHGLLQLRNRPQWKTIPGGARSYLHKLLAPLGNGLRLGTPVKRVERHEDHVAIWPAGGQAERFDQVVFAAHADQVLRMLADADRLERDLLSAFPYQRNEAVLHTDTSQLPRRRRAWASWNYRVTDSLDRPVSVTYDLSRLQGLDSPSPILLTLNPADGPEGRIDPRRILRHFAFEHPAYHLGSPAAQRRHQQLNGLRRTWYCGAYWGYGFHEDGVNSALAVARAFGKNLDSCTVACTKVVSGIGASVR